MFGRFHGRTASGQRVLDLPGVAGQTTLAPPWSFELCASSSANWSWLGCMVYSSHESRIPLFDRNDHPSVPTCLSADRRAQRQSKDAAANAAAPAEPAHSVVDRASTVLARLNGSGVRPHVAALPFCTRADRPC